MVYSIKYKTEIIVKKHKQYTSSTPAVFMWLSRILLQFGYHL